jgi:fumarate hydratase, class II
MKKMRQESDSMGPIELPEDALYGAQTARSLKHFAIGKDLMPNEVIFQYAILKKACAQANLKLGKLSQENAALISYACDEILSGNYMDAFPLFVYQTGSGTQTNMNVNEVISNIANLQKGHPPGSKKPIHPNDHVNMSQSSNDSFPTVMHMSSVHVIESTLIPALKHLIKELVGKQTQFESIIKIGRTHLMDAVPLTLGQEFSGYIAQLTDNLERITLASRDLLEVPIGGSAIGTGINTHKDFSDTVCQELTHLSNKHFRPSQNKFSQIAAHDRLIHLSSTLKTLSTSLMKIAHDLAWMGSGPRCGLGELILPENEPGSSIMPGKVNPTQCEALCMVAAQVIGYDTANSIGGALGNFELNVYKPLIINNIIGSSRLLSDAMNSFTNYFIKPLRANEARIKHLVDNSLMLVTALSPHIGYDSAAKLAHYAYEHNLSLKDAGLKLGLITESQYNHFIQIKDMIHPKP